MPEDYFQYWTKSFALITRDLATFKTVEGADGVLEYLKDEDGNYVYAKNNSSWNFWEKMLYQYGRDGFEAVSHSHTHKYWGESDEGGVFSFRLSDGRTVRSEDFPRGNVYAYLDVIPGSQGTVDVQ